MNLQEKLMIHVGCSSELFHHDIAYYSYGLTNVKNNICNKIILPLPNALEIN